MIVVNFQIHVDGNIFEVWSQIVLKYKRINTVQNIQETRNQEINAPFFIRRISRLCHGPGEIDQFLEKRRNFSICMIIIRMKWKMNLRMSYSKTQVYVTDDVVV